ncbi:MAG TPA: hypothetical protein VEB39_05345 [Sphingomicrobium sp.]|nr:hypothetical protein [Sphingomicrobium sp.]
MPYRHAHWWILALFPLAGFAFWPSYVSTITSASFEFHAHGITAALWLALLALQSWSIHSGSVPLHRLSGRSSLALFPLFMAGGAGIFLGMAQRYVSGSPFHAMYAPRLAWLDIVGVAGFAFCYFQALKWRRKAQIHSRYMLATVLFLLPPIFGRLSAIPLGVRGPEDFPKLELGFQSANLLAAGIGLWLASRPVKHGRPFLHAAGFILLSAILFQTVGSWPAWERFVASVALLPAWPLTLAAAIAGVAIGWAGWTAGKRPVTPGPGAVPA